jgi:uncharacterized protein
MVEYLSPGVYVEEVDTGPKPVEGVGTATAAFVGFTEKAVTMERVNGEVITRDLLSQPYLVTNWTQYTEHFGGFVDGAYLPHAVYGFFNNGGTRCYILSVKTMPKAQVALLNTEGKPQLLVRAKQAGYEGARLRVKVEPQFPPSSAKSGAKAGSEKKAEGEGEPAKAEASSGPPESFTLTVEHLKLSGGWQVKEVLRGVKLSQVKTSQGESQVRVVYKESKAPQLVDLIMPEATTPLAKLWPREQQQALNIEKGLLPAPTAEDFQGDVDERTGVMGLEALDDVNIICIPDLMATAPDQKLDLEMVKSVQAAMIAHCERLGDRLAIIDPPPGMSPQAMRQWRLNETYYDSSYAAMYYPWLVVRDPVTKHNIAIPPSGHVAGVWARVDGSRGVHKAPANEAIQGLTGTAFNITVREQDFLNPIGVNCIRTFPGMGLRIWGARTLSSNPSWRYINVRRLFNFVERSIELGTRWVVFEPNNQQLWSRIRRDVTNFLRGIWTAGALFGATADQAFFVKCDSEINPPEVLELGRLHIEIGLSVTRPAEFVIFRITQWSGALEGGEGAGAEGAGEAASNGASAEA